MIAPGKSSISLEEILSKVSEGEILTHYLGIFELPTIINSPLRVDNKPSFSLYSKDGIKVRYIDFSTRESGGLFDLLGKMWKCSFTQTLEKIYKEMCNSNIDINSPVINTPIGVLKPTIHHTHTELKCKVREWRDYDIKYWEAFGISLCWLKYAEVYPISHKIIIKNNKEYVFGADKYAYAYVERKEGKVTLKIYQPFNKLGYKWSNKHDSSVISLWTKVPKEGNKICICSSLKDALCLWSNTKIPAIAIQGEGYSMSETAINELKKRYKQVYIMLDNDEPGLKMGERLSKETNFINVVLPQFKEGKDISDFFKAKGKEEFIKTMNLIFE